jgi:thiol-disulfide isomerase/thioredoxin
MPGSASVLQGCGSHLCKKKCMKKNSNFKKPLLEWGIMLVAALLLYVSGLHTEVIGRVQQGILFSGIMRPDVEETLPAAENKDPEADFSMELRNQQGEWISMKDLRGKVIFLNLWATWCPPCVAEMPGIDALAKKIDDEDVVFLMLSLDKDFEKARQFRKRKDFSFDVYALEGKLPKMYYSQSIPTTYVISADGKLVLTHTGMSDYNTEEFKEFLLSQK